MNRSVLFQVAALMTLVTSLVAVIMLYLLSGRQEAALERSVLDELSGLSLAYSISVRSALEQEDLAALAELNEQVASDPRSPIIAILIEEDDTQSIFAFFPAGEDLVSIDEIYSDNFFSAERRFSSDIFEGTVIVLFKRETLEARLDSLNQPLYMAFGFICLLQIIFARQLSARVLIPIIEAAALADRLGERRYSDRLVKTSREDEIGQLASSLRRLKTNLRVQERENRRLFLSLEDTVEERTQELREALKAKDAFTASVSHELRTPLHSIIASLDLMSESDDSPKEGRNYLNIAQRASQALLVLINELLDFQRWEHEQITLVTEPTDLHQFLREIQTTTDILFDDSAIKFSALIDETNDYYLAMDAQRVGQILLNLLGNARKFTRQGEVVLEVSLLSQTPFDAEFLFVVEDTGIGIAPEDLSQIGEPYFQAAHGLNRKFSGTGLGLSIVKQLLETMGSRLNVSSTVGKGTVFDFTLKFSKLPEEEAPLTLLNAPKQVGEEVKKQKDLNILYVEDSETNQLVMSAMMERLGVSLALASSAKEGFDALRATAFDVIITDIQMPEHSGLDLLQWIQESPGIPTDLRIFACTANAGSDAVKEFEAAGLRVFSQSRWIFRC
ncbi:MAG: ATP-binding protein [Pseudomonadota bacterium]|nr:ATP-binding protein [Pseudomonadota bacterium]